MKYFLDSAIVLSLLFINAVAVAQQEKSPQELAQDAVEVRQSVFKLLDAHMKPIAAMARGRQPFDAALAQKNSERIGQLAAMIPDVFATDTRGFEVKTIALDKIWDNMDDFKQHAQALIEKAAAFNKAAQSGDMMTTMKELRPLGSACGNCHDNYRKDVK